LHYTINGRQYDNAANNITLVNPILTDTIVASTVLLTEVQPFMPQAQGTADSFLFASLDNPDGRALPITWPMALPG
jgi:hypothetical protein